MTRGVLTKFRLVQAPRGSRFLRKPAPCGRGGCAAPLAALEVVKKFLLLPIAGALPLHKPYYPRATSIIIITLNPTSVNSAIIALFSFVWLSGISSSITT
mgnify:CR=1 FL=1